MEDQVIAGHVNYRHGAWLIRIRDWSTINHGEIYDAAGTIEVAKRNAVEMAREVGYAGHHSWWLTGHRVWELRFDRLGVRPIREAGIVTEEAASYESIVLPERAGVTEGAVHSERATERTVAAESDLSAE